LGSDLKRFAAQKLLTIVSGVKRLAVKQCVASPTMLIEVRSLLDIALSAESLIAYSLCHHLLKENNGFYGH
jgi:hypothetical protein